MPHNDKPYIFISHATGDDSFVKELRIKLELLGLNVWVDSRNLRGGDQLNPEVEQAIKQSQHVIVVLSTKTINSIWVRDEILLAEKISNKQHRVIPLMLPGVEPAALKLWFKEEPIGLKIELEPGKLQEKLPDILSAIGERLPDDPSELEKVEIKNVAELLLELYNPKCSEQKDGTIVLSAEAVMVFTPVDTRVQPEVKSKRFNFVSPISNNDLDELRWYLEKYVEWPSGLILTRAKEFEVKLPEFGKALFDTTIGNIACNEVVLGWNSVRGEVERRFSIRVDSNLLEGASKEDQENAHKAGSELTSLPWELLHDGRNYLSDGAYPVRIRRRLFNYQNHLPVVKELPIRILLLSPRPEEEGVGYIDHRSSALPLVNSIESLGDLVKLTVLTPATYEALETELKRANDENQPYHVLHFDGHGVYDPNHGLGALCFEDPKDCEKLKYRRMQLVYAKHIKSLNEQNIASLLHDYRIPLVFLEACQTGQTENNPTASVAASLLEEGVSSVIAMSHSVLIETTKRFVTTFYDSLARGQRIGQAMLDGQRKLMVDTYRLPMVGTEDLHMQDWFIPLLYQEQYDPQLFNQIPSNRANRMRLLQQETRLGILPASPEHGFVGRSRELLMLERSLENNNYVVVQGSGGIGKTTLAIELTRWLVRSGRYNRCAFVSLEKNSNDRAMLDELGRQLVNRKYSVASPEYGNDLKKAIQPIQRVLENDSCLILIDNVESVLADESQYKLVFSMCEQLFSDNTSLIFTTRLNLPSPFDHKKNKAILGELNNPDAKKLIMQVLSEQSLELTSNALGDSLEAVDDLINLVNGHARALVLLTRELSSQGIESTTKNLKLIMEELDKKHGGDRELSLFASVELSLHHLSLETRDLIKGLGVFKNGGIIHNFSHVLDLDREKTTQLCEELVRSGLAIEKDHDYFRFDPAFSDYLDLQLNTTEKTIYEERWSEATSNLAFFLHNELFNNYSLSNRLTKLELPNIIAYTNKLDEKLNEGVVEAEYVAHFASMVENLFANIQLTSSILDKVINTHKNAIETLGDWSNLHFINERMKVERLYGEGNKKGAYIAALELHQKCEEAGSNAYTDADYDLLVATSLLGRIVRFNGNATEGLRYIERAQEYLVTLSQDDDEYSNMHSVLLTDKATCLRDLGKLDQAATILNTAIEFNEKRGALRNVAIDKMQLGSVRIDQDEYESALILYKEAEALFLPLEDFQQIARIYHQVGMIHKSQKEFDLAESIYLKALSLEVQYGDSEGEAAVLGGMGVLYQDWKRYDLSVKYLNQSIDIYIELKNKRLEGHFLNNLGNSLIQLQNYDDAREKLHRAIDCKKELGHAASPWHTWGLLRLLEKTVGNQKASDQAQEKAIQTYLEYRADGGEITQGIGKAAGAVFNSINENMIEKAQQDIESLLDNNKFEEDNNTFLCSLLSILKGGRNTDLTKQYELRFDLVAELILLLSILKEKEL